MNRLDREMIIPAAAREENLERGFVRSSKEVVPGTTFFFREPSSLKTVVERLAPKFGPQVTIASVGCSTGEEVYSLLLEARLNGWESNFNVDGYDYREDRLMVARSGKYKHGGRYLGWHKEAIKRQVTQEVEIPQEGAGFTIPSDLQNGASYHFMCTILLFLHFPRHIQSFFVRMYFIIIFSIMVVQLRRLFLTILHAR